MTRLSIWPQIASRLAVSVSATAWSISSSTSGIRTLRLDEPPVSRMTRLSTICDRKPKPSFQSAPQPLIDQAELVGRRGSCGLPAYSEK